MPRSTRHDDDDDRPQPRRRDRDADRPAKKKGSVVPLILGIVGGVIVLCAGGCAGIWFAVLKPKYDQAKQKLDEAEAELKVAVEKAKPTAKERPKEEPPVATLTVTQLVDSLRADRKKYDKKWITVTGPVTLVNTDSQPGKPDWGYVHLGALRTGLVVCHFKSDEWAKLPKFDDAKTYAITGLFDANELGVSMDWCRVTGETGPIAKPDPKPADKTPVATLTADELAEQQATFKDKWVTLKGKFRSPVQGDGGGVNLLAPSGKSLIVSPPIGTKFGWKTPPQPLDELEFTGKVGGNDRNVTLTDAALLKQAPSAEVPVQVTADDLTAEFDKDTDAATKKYTGKLLQVTGKASSTASAGNRVSVRGLQDASKKKGYFVECFFEGDARDAAKGVKLQEQVTFVGLFGGIKKGAGETYTVTLTVGRVVK